MNFKQKESYDIHDLLAIIALLRGQDGCPWDKEQDHHSIRKNLLEEAYEAAEAIDLEDKELLKEELGDVLMQVVFHSQIEQETDGFSFQEVCDGVCKKLIVRHPHVFGDVSVHDSNEVLSNWENIKRKTKGQKTYTQTLQSVPKPLPALSKNEKILKRAAKAGFSCWKDQQALLQYIEKKLQRLQEKLMQQEKESATNEYGELLFALTELARVHEIDGEEALEKTCNRFIDSFAKMEQLAIQKNVSIDAATTETLLELFREANHIGS